MCIQSYVTSFRYALRIQGTQLSDYFFNIPTDAHTHTHTLYTL